MFDSDSPFPQAIPALANCYEAAAAGRRDLRLPRRDVSVGRRDTRLPLRDFSFGWQDPPFAI
jgi:hypothetical protein